MGIFKRQQKEITLNLEQVESIIYRWTDDKINDPVADRDALEAIMTYLREDKDEIKAALRINEIRREKIKEVQEEEKQFYQEDE